MRALTVAKYLIDKSREAGHGDEYGEMSLLKLQKILYYAQGWYLGINGKPLFDDPIYAWKLGPVTKSVYHDLKQFGGKNIAASEWNCSTGAQVEDPSVMRFLDYTWEQYAVEDANSLVTRTHDSDPWLDAIANPYSKEITQEVMEEYFRKLL